MPWSILSVDVVVVVVVVVVGIKCWARHLVLQVPNSLPKTHSTRSVPLCVVSALDSTNLSKTFLHFHEFFRTRPSRQSDRLVVWGFRIQNTRRVRLDCTGTYFLHLLKGLCEFVWLLLPLMLFCQGSCRRRCRSANHNRELLCPVQQQSFYSDRSPTGTVY
jgi:hypothetical protein